jgi:hypothetical protein
MYTFTMADNWEAEAQKYIDLDRRKRNKTPEEKKLALVKPKLKALIKVLCKCEIISGPEGVTVYRGGGHMKGDKRKLNALNRARSFGLDISGYMTLKPKRKTKRGNNGNYFN